MKDGELNLNITAPNETLCINLCYIKIYLPEDAKVTPAPTETPCPTETPEPTAAPTEAPVEPTDAPSITDTSADSKGGSALPLVAGGAAIIGAIAGALTYFFKKKKK